MRETNDFGTPLTVAANKKSHLLFVVEQEKNVKEKTIPLQVIT